MSEEERTILRRGAIVVCCGVLGFLFIAWIFSALGCWTAHAGRILPCAVEVWWKGRT